LAGFIKCAIDMGSDAPIHMPSFTKIDSDVQKLIRGTQTGTAWRSLKPTIIFFKIREVDKKNANG
jgi:hypothetical protein